MGVDARSAVRLIRFGATRVVSASAGTEAVLSCYRAVCLHLSHSGEKGWRWLLLLIGQDTKRKTLDAPSICLRSAMSGS